MSRVFRLKVKQATEHRKLHSEELDSVLREISGSHGGEFWDDRIVGRCVM
jgi:hypothetical protein